MTNARTNAYYTWLGELKRHGWQAEREDSIKGNGGAETDKHIHAKTAAFNLLKDHGYRVSTEVVHDTRGEADLVAIACDENEAPFCVEFETDPTEDVKQDKLERYTFNTVMREMYLINLDKLSTDITTMREQIATELGVDV